MKVSSDRKIGNRSNLMMVSRKRQDRKVGEVIKWKWNEKTVQYGMMKYLVESD